MWFHVQTLQANTNTIDLDKHVNTARHFKLNADRRVRIVMGEEKLVLNISIWVVVGF